jgi:hypothetical protein
MLVFKDEVEAGLKDKVLANKSISYFAKAEPYQPKDKQKENIIGRFKANFAFNRDMSPLSEELEKSFACLTDNDLYYGKSILVTSCWNLNDDVFHALEVWAARNTPSHKPTNLSHDEHQVVGHITEVWPVSDEGALLDDTLSADEIPDYYHLLNGSVIYKSWSDPKLVERTQKLIEEIEAGTKFVSMEAHFTGFDYAVKKTSGEMYVVPRDKATAFLTKHLRCYGGKGEYEGYKLGRLLRGITFCGKGYVDDPGNPDSVIFNNATNFKFSVANAKENTLFKNIGVYPTREKTESENKMSDVNTKAFEDTIAELKAALKASNEKYDALAAEAKKAAEDKVAAEMTVLKGQVEAAKKSEDETKKKNEKMEKDYAELKDNLEKSTKANDELSKKVAKIEAEKAESERVTKLVEGGLDKETALAKVKTFIALSDEQFKDVAEALVEVAKSKKAPITEKSEAEKAKEAKAALEKAEAEKVVTPTGDETENKVEATRKQISEFLAPRLKKETKTAKKN